jgi:hemerythrin superfamily protein
LSPYDKVATASPSFNERFATAAIDANRCGAHETSPLVTLTESRSIHPRRERARRDACQGRRPMKATDLLEFQHDEAEKLFKKIEASDDPAERRELFDELAANLTAHDAIEREIFYPAAEKAIGPLDVLGEALVEHGLVEFALYTTDGARMHKGFRHRLSVLFDVWRHHVEDEETRLLPKVERVLDRRMNDELGAQMERVFQEKKREPFRAPLLANLQEVLDGALKTKPALGEAPPPRVVR